MFPSKVMFSSWLVLSYLSFADASPIARNARANTLQFMRSFKASNGTRVLDYDQARAASLRKGRTQAKRDGTLSVINAQVTYVAQVGVGDGTYNLIIDSGSSNTWVGADASNPYQPSSNSQDTGNSVTVSYGSGSFSGEEYTDSVYIGDLMIWQQSIGIAYTSEGFSGVDGILGVGPTSLTEGTVSNTDTVPTVTDNLQYQGDLSSETLGIYYAPAASTDSTGELSFGSPDYSKTTSSIQYVPITSTSPASEYWGIQQSISYGDSEILSTTAGIVDSGTTLILIASNAFSQYQTLTGGQIDDSTGLLMITQDQYQNLQNLNFNIGSSTYPLSANAQIWPRSLNTILGGSPDGIYLVVCDIGYDSGSGLDFINGYSFFERYYSVFDTTNSQVGFASTEYTWDESN